ncbi:MAG: S-layer homology domain-containing protein [Oscillospiraceae bacterium]|nr:S-layer homology domain-containing protein [Oscillospiraceae bacterium]
MSLKRTVRKLVSLLCCAAMLMPCVPAAYAAGELFTEGFEDYTAGVITDVPHWKSNGNSTTEFPAVVTDVAHSGKQSLMLKDTKTEAKDGAVQLTVPSNVVKCSGAAGTEVIASVWYKTSGEGSYLFRLTAGSTHKDVKTDSSTQWKRISVINTTAKDNDSLRVWLVSSAANTGTVWFDDVRVEPLTRELAVRYLNEKVAQTEPVAAEITKVLNTKALGITERDSAMDGKYVKRLQTVRAEQGADLTFEQIQGCINDVNLTAFAESLKGSTLAVGKVGEIAVPSLALPGGATAKWVSVSPTGKNIAVSGGKASAAAIPNGSDDTYTLTLRLATAGTAVDVPYTVQLKNAESYDKEMVAQAARQLRSAGVIGASHTGAVSLPAIQAQGVTAQWSAIKSGNAGRLSLSGGTLSVNALPAGTAFDEVTVSVKLTRGGVSQQVDCIVVVYDPAYRLLLDLNNPGFESVSGELPTDWNASNTPVAAAWIELAPGVARTGSNGVRIVDTTVGNSMGVRSRLDGVPAKVGVDYEGTGWAKGTATSEQADRAGAAGYLEFSNGTTRKSVVGGVCVPINSSSWTRFAVRGTATDNHVSVMGYSYQATICDMYVDDFLLWEITPAGALADINAQLTGKGDAAVLYQRLSSGMLKLTGLVSANQQDYLTALTAKRASKGSDLTAEELNAEIAAINTRVTERDKQQAQQAAKEVPDTITLTQAGAIPLPAVTDRSVTLAWTAKTGDPKGRITVEGGGARLNSVPAFGEQNENAILTLTATKGMASVKVEVKVVIKAISRNMRDMVAQADQLSVESYLDGQSVSCVKSDLKSLPSGLAGGITVKWQAMDSATGLPSNAISANGSVTRPAYGEPDAAVILCATLTKNGESMTCRFPLIVASLGVDDARQVVTENVDFEAPAPKDEYSNITGWNKRLKWADGKNEELTSYANIDAANAFSGKQALRITADGKMASVQNEAVFTVQEGRTYTLETMVYAQTGTVDPCITLRFWNMEGVYTQVHTVRYKDVPGQFGNWKNLSLSVVAPVGAVQVTAELDGGTKAGVVWFDAVRLREYPIVPNGSFTLGKAGWTTNGTVSDKLTLSAGQTAVSMVRGADRGVAYWLTLTADGGRAALRFVDKDGKTLAEYGRNLTNGANAFAAHAPVGTKGVCVVLTGAMTADEVQILRAPYGNSVGDGDFESDMGTAWELTNASVAAGTGRSGAGLTVRNGGQAVSGVIPTVDGKTYTFTADVKGKGTMTVGLYNIGLYGTLQKSWAVSSESDDWNTISCSLDPVPQGGSDRNFYEHAYVRITLTGEAVFDHVKVYNLTKSVSNASFENINDAVSGSFPYSWTPYGEAAVCVANGEGQTTEGLSGLAVQTFGQGGVRSSMLRDIRGGQSYEATVKAKGAGAKLSIEFWGKDFAKLGSQSVTISSADWKQYSVTASAPKGSVYASLSVCGEGAGLVYVDQAALYPTVRTIGTNVQLFLDDWLIADSANIRRTFHPGEKMEPMMDRRWYGSQFWNEDKQIYEAFNTGSPNYAMYYHTSKDGVNWDAGVMCHCDLTETADCMPGPSVFYDRDEKTYKAIFYDHGSEWYVLCTSTDAIHWTTRTPILKGWDVIMVAYDEVNDEYVCTYKLTQANGPDGVKQEKRVHSTAVSRDLIHWTEGTRVFNIGSQQDVGDDFIRIDSYGTNIDALGDSYVGFNERFSLDDADGYGGLMDSNLLFSRDLSEDWTRIYDANGQAVTVIPRGAAGSWDDGQTYPRFPVRMGDETWWYYHGWTGEHGVAGVPKTSAVSAIKWRLNGYMSLDFGTNAALTTKQFILSGDGVYLNAKGELTVELLDAGGAVAATGKFSGDSVDGAVVWDKSISGQLGKAVSLRITGSDAQLYTIQVKGSVFDDVATDAWYHQAVHYAVSNGIMSGYGGGKFGPNDTLSRAMVVQVLYNKEGQLPVSSSHGFDDVPADQWFNNAVTWGTANKVMSGYGGGKFGPNDAVTVEQIAVILWNYSGNPEFRCSADDLGEHSGWAANALAGLWIAVCWAMCSTAR